MIKLKTAIPIAALSLATITMASCSRNTKVQEPQRTEFSSKTNQAKAQDSFEKNETNKENQEEKSSPWLVALALAAGAGLAAYIHHDHKKLKEDPEYARIWLQLNGDYYPESND